MSKSIITEDVGPSAEASAASISAAVALAAEARSLRSLGFSCCSSSRSAACIPMSVCAARPATAARRRFRLRLLHPPAARCSTRYTSVVLTSTLYESKTDTRRRRGLAARCSAACAALRCLLLPRRSRVLLHAVLSTRGRPCAAGRGRLSHGGRVTPRGLVARAAGGDDRRAGPSSGRAARARSLARGRAVAASTRRRSS